jgi:hypothetical protein
VLCVVLCCVVCSVVFSEYVLCVATDTQYIHKRVCASGGVDRSCFLSVRFSEIMCDCVRLNVRMRDNVRMRMSEGEDGGIIILTLTCKELSNVLQ